MWNPQKTSAHLIWQLGPGGYPIASHMAVDDCLGNQILAQPFTIVISRWSSDHLCRCTRLADSLTWENKVYNSWLVTALWNKSRESLVWQGGDNGIWHEMYPAVRINMTVLSPCLFFLCFKLGALEIEKKSKRNKAVSIAELFGEHVGLVFLQESACKISWTLLSRSLQNKQTNKKTLWVIKTCISTTQQ